MEHDINLNIHYTAPKESLGKNQYDVCFHAVLGRK